MNRINMAIAVGTFWGLFVWTTVVVPIKVFSENAIGGLIVGALSWYVWWYFFTEWALDSRGFMHTFGLPLAWIFGVDILPTR